MTRGEVEMIGIVEDDHKTIVIMIATIIAVVAIVAVITMKAERKSSRSRGTVVGWSPLNDVQMMCAMAESADSEVEMISTTQNWDLVMNVSNRSFLVQVTLALISTNTKIYPWKRRARMFQLISPVLTICS